MINKKWKDLFSVSLHSDLIYRSCVQIAWFWMYCLKNVMDILSQVDKVVLPFMVLSGQLRVTRPKLQLGSTHNEAVFKKFLCGYPEYTQQYM